MEIGVKLRKWQGKTCTIEKLRLIQWQYTEEWHKTRTFKVAQLNNDNSNWSTFFLTWKVNAASIISPTVKVWNEFLPSHSFVSNDTLKKWQNPWKSKHHQFAFSDHALQGKVNPKYYWLIWREMAFLITLDHKITVHWKKHLSISLIKPKLHEILIRISSGMKFMMIHNVNLPWMGPNPLFSTLEVFFWFLHSSLTNQPIICRRKLREFNKWKVHYYGRMAKRSNGWFHDPKQSGKGLGFFSQNFQG